MANKNPRFFPWVLQLLITASFIATSIVVVVVLVARVGRLTVFMVIFIIHLENLLSVW